jgi:hypothetical protein
MCASEQFQPQSSILSLQCSQTSILLLKPKNLAVPVAKLSRELRGELS